MFRFYVRMKRQRGSVINTLLIPGESSVWNGGEGRGGGGFLGFKTKRVPEPFGKFCVEPFKRQIEALLYNRIFLLLLLSVYVFVNVNKMRREPTSRVQGIVFILFYFLVWN